MYEIMICPLKRLYQYADDGDMSNVAVLAVSSYDVNQEKLKGFRSVLCLDFEDVCNSTDSYAFSNESAEKIAEYIRGLPASLDTLFVCCDSGESRSSAMAAAIQKYNELDDMKIWRNPRYHPNPLVYQLLCNAFSINVTNQEINHKLHINQQSFAEAIKG